MLAYLPSPSSGAIHLGPLQLRAYGLCIAAGVWAAVVVAARRYRARGGNPELITSLAVWAVPAGILGARIYHVATDYELYFGQNGHPLNALKIWDGGLGIWGGILLGVVVGAWVARRRGADVALLFDCVAPALPLAQAIGRWGNWWNQELFGKPTKLPWAVEIDLAHRPSQYLNFSTFQPTFLYESLWDLCVVGIVLLVERRFRLRRGSLLAVYVAAYTFGRFFTEYERVDFAHKIGPLRLNDWTSVIVFIAAVVALVVANRRPEPTSDAGGSALGWDQPKPTEVVVEHQGQPLRLDVVTRDREVVITLAGELDLATAPELWAAIDDALAHDHHQIVLDLSGLAFVDSTGLGVFVRAGKELRSKGGQLTLRAPGERVAKLLEITGLEEVFDIE